MKRVIAALAVMAILSFGLVVYVLMAAVAVLGAGSEPPLQSCVRPVATPPVTVAGLSSTQLRHAETVVRTGIRRGESPRALIVALATAAQESRFLNYANDGTSPDLGPAQAGVAASLNYPHDAVGNDHGSVGVFQQQYPWWGTLAELMDPQTASEKFYDALAQVDGWESMPVAQAAQAVQRSAFPDAYAQWEPLARELLDQLAGLDGQGPAPCGMAGQPAAGDWMLPLQRGTYQLGSSFGMRIHPITGENSLHTGVDLAADAGTPVRAASSGRVTYAGWQGRYGNLVIIETAGVAHYYAHLQHGSSRVDAGQPVMVGQVIGAVGSTGFSTGPHLHFEIRVDGSAVDPVAFLRQRGIEPGDPQ